MTENHPPAPDGDHAWSCYTASPAESLALFEAARQKCPVAHSTEHDGFAMLLNYADVRDAMANFRLFSSEPQVLRPMLPRKPVPALEMDPPRHGPWRAIFNRAITPAIVANMEPFVRADITHHIDAFIEAGKCDLVSELAEPVPAETICRLVGLDAELVPAVRELALKMFAAQGDPEEFGRRQAAFGAVTVAEILKRRTHPRDDYLTQLAGMEIDGRKLDEDDYVVLLSAFLGAGHHSTTSAMASLMQEVFSNPHLRDEIKQDPTKILPAIDESLRLRPPFYGFYRRATSTTQIAGVEIEAGTDVYMGWAAANRDPEVFECPAEFRIDRPAHPHLSFGFGRHVCPGAPLARMEMRVLLEELFRRLPDLRIETNTPAYQFGGGDYAFLPALHGIFTPGRKAGPQL